MTLYYVRALRLEERYPAAESSLNALGKFVMERSRVYDQARLRSAAASLCSAASASTARLCANTAIIAGPCYCAAASICTAAVPLLPATASFLHPVTCRPSGTNSCSFPGPVDYSFTPCYSLDIISSKFSLLMVSSLVYF